MRAGGSAGRIVALAMALVALLALAACENGPPPRPGAAASTPGSNAAPTPMVRAAAGPPGNPAVAAAPGAPARPAEGPQAAPLAVFPSSFARSMDVNGARLFVEATGPATPIVNPEVIVLIHHFTMDARMWDDQMAEFAQRHRVIRYDARGFGRSASITGPYSPRDDLRALLDSLGVQRAHVVGLSMGARYAIDFALANPERVRSLVLADPTVSGLGWSFAYAQEFGQATAAARAGNLGEAKRRWLATSLFNATRDRPAVMERVRAMVAGYSGWHFANADPAIALQPAAVNRLGSLRVPTLVLVGERSIGDVHMMADKVAKDVPRARKQIIAGVGHMSNMEAPALFNRAVLEFLARIGAAAQG